MKQIHNLAPIYNQDSKMLILGSFPSIKSRETQFYYNNPQNRFWKMINGVFNSSASSIEERTQLCLQNHIALWDVIFECEIKGSSDLSIKEVIPNDIASLINDTAITTIITNGKAAHQYYEKYIFESTQIKDINLPSTSSANAKYKLEDLIDFYKPYLK